jgi:Uncharacterized protein conserved in bacteria
MKNLFPQKRAAALAAAAKGALAVSAPILAIALLVAPPAGVGAFAQSSAAAKPTAAKPAPARNPLPIKKRDANSGSVVITSDRLEFDYSEFVALFDGNVKVNDPTFTLIADKMLVFLENTNDIKRVDAIGNVHLTSGDMTATCGKATYTAKNGIVVVQTVNPDEPTPIVTKGENRITGKKMSIWLNEQRVIVEENVALETLPANINTPASKAK